MVLPEEAALLPRMPGREVCGDCAGHVEKKTPQEVVPGLPDPLPEPEMTPLPEGYLEDPRVRNRHLSALRWLIKQDVPPPAKASGDGLVFCGAGRYWPMCVASVRMTRKVTDLPIQVWRSRGQDLDPDDLKGVPGVTYHDAWQYPHRRLHRWETKTIALVNCGFERVLCLDADAYCLADPQVLLDSVTDVAYWANIWQNGLRDRLNRWDLTPEQVPEPPQGGHYLVHRRSFWKWLAIWHWMCQHGEYTYPLESDTGDEGCLRFLIALTGAPYRCLGPASWLGIAAGKGCFVPKFDGRDMIVHRCQAKVVVESDPRIPGENEYMGHMADYAKRRSHGLS